MLKMMIFGIIITLLGISLLVISYNDELEAKTIERIHKNLRQTSITVGWILVGLGILLCVWSIAFLSKK
jgi:uncharacterized membrane protein YczE